MRVVINGACGRMGKTLCALIGNTRHSLAAGVDPCGAEGDILAERRNRG